MIKACEIKWKKNSLIMLAVTKIRDNYESLINYLLTLVEKINENNQSNSNVAVIKNTREESASDLQVFSLLLESR